MARPCARFALCGAWVLAVVAGPAQGADAWHALGPERIGARFEDISRAVPLQCRDEGATRVCTVTLSPAVFDEVPAMRIEAVFDAGHLHQVRVLLDIEHYEPVLRSHAARYGTGEDRSFQAIAGMGGEFTAGVTVWREAAVNLVLEQYAGKIDRSLLTYGSAQAMDKLLRKTGSYPRGARRDL